MPREIVLFESQAHPGKRVAVDPEAVTSVYEAGLPTKVTVVADGIHHCVTGTFEEATGRLGLTVVERVNPETP